MFNEISKVAKHSDSESFPVSSSLVKFDNLKVQNGVFFRS